MGKNYIVKVPVESFLLFSVEADSEEEAKEIVGNGDGECLIFLSEEQQKQLDFFWDPDANNWEVQENQHIISTSWSEVLEDIWGKVPCTHCGKRTQIGDMVKIFFSNREEGSEEKIEKLLCEEHLNK